MWAREERLHHGLHTAGLGAEEWLRRCSGAYPACPIMPCHALIRGGRCLWPSRRLAAARSALMPLLLCWWGLNFGYYGLSTWISVVISKLQLGNAYLITLMYQVASAPANALSVYLVCQPRFALRGRKCVLVLGMGFSAACAFGLGALSSEDEEARKPAARLWK